MVKQVSNKLSQLATRPPVKAPEQYAPRIYFPFGSYTSVVGVHTSLLAFAALFLPRTPVSIFTQVETPRGSVPVPQNALLILTEDPTRTVAWMCVGAFILQSWWASWLRGWALGAPEIASDSVEQTRLKLERSVWNSGRLKVGNSRFPVRTVHLNIYPVGIYECMCVFDCSICCISSDFDIIRGSHYIVRVQDIGQGE